MTTNALIGHGSLFQLLDTTLSPPAYVTIAEVTTITPFSIARDAVETTHTESPDRIREFIPGLVDYGDTSIELNWDPASGTDKRIRDLFATRELSSAQIVFPTSPAETLQFSCLATAYSPAAPLDDKMTASATFKISGKPTFVSETPETPVELLTDGLISAWSFSEGSGTTVADDVGSRPINLAAPTTPNYTWNARGVALAAGLIQTPSITGARTVVALYKVDRGNASSGFILSGGDQSGSGWSGSTVSEPTTARVGVNGRVVPVRSRLSSGQNAWIVNRGGYVVAFREFSQAYNTILGFGGRHSTTTSRCSEFELMWAGVYDDQLTDAECTTILRYLENLARGRGVFLRASHCPAQADVLAVRGQSNADGRALISALSAGDQALTFAKTKAVITDQAPRATLPPADYALAGSSNGSVTYVGPEYETARLHEAGQSRPLYISKVAQGSSELADSATEGGTIGVTWNVDELPTGSLWHSSLSDYWDLEQWMLLNGIGPNLRGLFWMQGEQDATAATMAAAYADNLAALYADVVLHMGLPAGARFVIGRIADDDAAQTHKDTVRAAQAAFAAATDGVEVIDTDAFGMLVDSVHYDAAGTKALGAAVYAEIWGA